MIISREDALKIAQAIRRVDAYFCLGKDGLRYCPSWKEHQAAEDNQVAMCIQNEFAKLSNSSEDTLKAKV